jgi:Peptidase inhibitor family I36
MFAHRKFVATLLATAALSGSGVAMGQTANAAPTGCPASKLCVYPDIFYGGPMHAFRDTNPSWESFGIEDQDSSWFNNGTTGASVRVYVDRGFGGDSICFARGDGDQIALLYQDAGSSNLWVSTC